MLITIAILALVVTISPYIMNGSANAQYNTDSGNQYSNDIQTNGNYVSSYPVATADITIPVTIYIDHHLYKPGDTMTVRGSVWLELVKRVDSLDLVKVEVKDGNGNEIGRASCRERV